MSEELAFRMQLGIILPKLKEKIASSTSEILGELVAVLREGTREGEELEIEPIKEMFMKDFEIFLDDVILPDIEKQIHPPVEEEPAPEEAAEEPEAEEAGEEEAAE
ncbi:MAG: hypothetical protein GY710_04655 [Desulfobacteraceae bacterium]|nr:hypothetical protein [Desulfobacteraceae bacterium]